MRLIVSTAPIDAAPRIAKTLVEERLAACVNVIPKARSFYVWKGALCDEEESVLLAKTTAARASALTARLKELHPYEVPEIVCLEVRPGEGNPDYLSWVEESVG